MFRKSIFIVIAWFLFCSVHSRVETKPAFAVQVAFQTQSQMYTLLVYINNGRTLTNKKYITKDEFIRFATGNWPSIYNPKRLNFLSLNNIPNCGLIKDSITGKEIPYCASLDSIWKIRWSDFPFNFGKDTGWAGETRKPSNKQARYLYDTYGVYNIDLNFFEDTSFWKIMRDVQDPVWIENYKAMK
jgi:hypothetical protein